MYIFYLHTKFIASIFSVTFLEKRINTKVLHLIRNMTSGVPTGIWFLQKNNRYLYRVDVYYILTNFIQS